MHYQTLPTYTHTLIHFEGPWTNYEKEHLATVAQLIHHRHPVSGYAGKPWVCTCEQGATDRYYFANHVANVDTIFRAKTVGDLAVYMMTFGHFLGRKSPQPRPIN